VGEERLADALQSQLQGYLNCVELCRALHRQTKDPYLKKALELLVEELQESLSSLAGHLRRLGAAPGGRELDSAGMARIQQVLSIRALYDQMLVVRQCLVDLVEWYESYLPPLQAGQGSCEWLISISEEARRILKEWDRQMGEMVAP
jgi:hypothetical protein